MSKETQQLIKRAERRGWKFRKYTGSSHYQMTWPGGGMVTFPSTPGAHRRSIENTEAQMRRVEKMNPLDDELVG